jgi:hypothetical protein
LAILLQPSHERSCCEYVLDCQGLLDLPPPLNVQQGILGDDRVVEQRNEGTLTRRLSQEYLITFADRATDECGVPDYSRVLWAIVLVIGCCLLRPEIRLLSPHASVDVLGRVSASSILQRSRPSASSADSTEDQIRHKDYS